MKKLVVLALPALLLTGCGKSAAPAMPVFEVTAGDEAVTTPGSPINNLIVEACKRHATVQLNVHDGASVSPKYLSCKP